MNRNVQTNLSADVEVEASADLLPSVPAYSRLKLFKGAAPSPCCHAADGAHQ